MCSYIPIINDMLEEDVETFFVNAYAFGPCIAISADHDQALVSIADNDGKIIIIL